MPIHSVAFCRKFCSVLSLILLPALVLSSCSSSAPRAKDFDLSKDTRPLNERKTLVLSSTKPITEADPTILNFEIQRIETNNYPKEIRAIARVYDSTGNIITNLAPPYCEDLRYWGAIKEKLGKQTVGIDKFTVREFGDKDSIPYNVMLTIDYSGSMNSGGRDGKLKIDSAREALAEVLNALPEKTEFNIIAFSTEPRAWRDTLQAKSKSTVEDALDFARKTQVRGSTNFFDALEQAMNMNEADSIVMLSDGAPSAGAYIFFSRIRHQVRALNRMRKVAVSAIALETTADANRFLSELAKDTGGEFVER